MRAEPNKISFTVSLPGEIVSLNYYERLHWYRRNKLKSQLKEDIGWLIRSKFSEKVPDWGKISVSFLIRSARRLDVDNRVSVAKVVLDSIKENRLIADDSPDFVTYELPKWEKKDGEPEVVVEIERQRR